MNRHVFETRVRAVWPKAVIRKVVSINNENHLALVTIGTDGQPFFVGLKHGIPSPFDMRTVEAALQHYKDIVFQFEGAMDVMKVLMVPHEKRDWTAFNALVGIDPKDAQTD